MCIDRSIERNHPRISYKIEEHFILINGSDETVHHKPLLLSHGRPIAIGCVREGHVLMHYKMRETAAVGSRSDAPDAFHRD